MPDENVIRQQLEVVEEPPLPSPNPPHGLLERLVYPFQRPQMPEVQPPVGFFTDTSVCIGCKACQVACKEWNMLPAVARELSGQSYDNTLSLGAEEWRHVKFVEVFESLPLPPPPLKPLALAGGFDLQALLAEPKDGQWLMLSDSCKHCAAAPCHLACPTGAIVYTEFANVYIQPDICNGCASCIAACPFGVITRGQADGHAAKCTMCYDRLRDGLHPACARACPTWAITFGPIDEMRRLATERVQTLRERGVGSAYLYGAEASDDYSALHNFYLLLAEPAAYGLPDRPFNPHLHVTGDYLRTAVGLGVALLILIAALLAGGG